MRSAPNTGYWIKPMRPSLSKKSFPICFLAVILLAPCAVGASDFYIQKTVKSGPVGEAQLVLDKRYIALLLALDTTFPDDFRVEAADMRSLFDSYNDKVTVSPDFESYLRAQHSLRAMVDTALTEWYFEFECSSLTNLSASMTTTKTRELRTLLRIFEADNQRILDSFEQKLMEKVGLLFEAILSRREWERLPTFAALMPVTAYILVGNNVQSVEGMAGGSREASSSRFVVCMGSTQGDVLVLFHELAHVLYRQTSTTDTLLENYASSAPDGFFDDLVLCCKKVPNGVNYPGKDAESMIRHCIEAPYTGFDEFFAYSVSHYVVTKYFDDMPHSRKPIPEFVAIDDKEQLLALSSLSEWLMEHDVYERVTMNTADKAFWWDLFQSYVACVSHGFEYARAQGRGLFR